MVLKMNIKFSDYFSAGVSWNKLESELPYPIKLQDEFIIVEHEEIPEEIQQNILNVCRTHLPDETPFIYAVTVEATAANLIKHLSGVIISISSFGNLFYLTFGELPDLSQIQLEISNYVEPEPIYDVIFQKKLSENVIKNNYGESLVMIQPNEIIVSKNFGQFTSIVEALKTVGNYPVIIKIYPGIYYETEPIELPESSCLIGQGSGGNTFVVGAHAGAVIKTSKFHTIKNLHIIGGSVSIQHDGTDSSIFSQLKDCMIKVSGIGILTTGGLGSIVLSHVSFYSDGPVLANISAQNSSVIMSEVIMQSQATTGILLESSKLTIDITSIYNCVSAINVSKNSTIKGTLVNILNSTKGLVASGVERAGEISINYLHVDGAEWDIFADTEAVIEIYSGHIDMDRVKKNSSTVLTGIFTNEEKQVINGTINIPESVNFGGADFNKFGQYFSCGSVVNNFMAETVELVEYFNGTNWISVRFYKMGHHVWLDANYAPARIELNGINDYWIKITGSAPMVVNCGLYLNAGNMTYCLRKQETIYTPFKSFLLPENIDKSSDYEVIIKANPGIFINDEFFASDLAIKKISLTTDSIQNFTVVANGIVLQAIRYYIISP